MEIVEKLFNWMLVIGLVLMIGRLVTAVCVFFDIPFVSFFGIHNMISMTILIVGIVGTEIMKEKRNKKRD